MRYFSLLSMIFLTANSLAQNVGIGTTNPQTPLDLRSTITNHVLRIDGTAGTYLSINENGTYRGYLGSFAGENEDVDFGTGTSNNNGKVHLTIQGNPRLTIDPSGNVGINNNNPQWQLDVNGSMNLTGRLNAGGSSGVAGQALVSNGLSAPTWQSITGAFQNTVRFEATFNAESGGIGNLFYTTLFNTNTSAVTIASSGVTITKTGLYHIEGYYQSFTGFATEPAYFGHSLSLAFGTRSYVQASAAPFEKSASTSAPQASYNKLVNFVQEVYIVAPTTISLLRTNNFPVGLSTLTNSHSGRISGYLIAD